MEMVFVITERDQRYHGRFGNVLLTDNDAMAKAYISIGGNPDDLDWPYDPSREDWLSQDARAETDVYDED